jgi:hypothetical protein
MIGLHRSTKVVLLSTFIAVGGCNGQVIVPLTSTDDVIVLRGKEKVQTQLHVVDPWIRPPRGTATQFAIGKLGDFSGYPRIMATPFDRIKFVMRPVDRGVNVDNTQRHGVYVITNKQLVQNYLDGVSEHPCGMPTATTEEVCQVVEFEGLQSTACPDHATLFPLLEIFGTAGEIEYTAFDLGGLAAQYGVELENGNRVLAFDCPWIQGRSELVGTSSHCTGGMFLIVEVEAPPPPKKAKKSTKVNTPPNMG